MQPQQWEQPWLVVSGSLLLLLGAARGQQL